MKQLLVICMLLLTVYAKAQIGIGTTSPNSTLDVRGSMATAIVTFSSNTTAGASDNFLAFTGTSAATLTLPTAVGITGRNYWIKNASSNASALTIATTSSQTIDGLTSWTLTQSNKAMNVVSNGSNWYISTESVPGSSGTAWVLGGNNVSSQQNIGTTSNYHLPFITNNTEKMRLTSTGSLGIGTSTFNGTYPERLLVDAGSTGNTNYQNVIVGKGNTNSYAQLNIQNNSSGTAASSDVVATANNGSETVNFIDMGINGGGNTSSGVLGGANTAYIYSTGEDFVIGNSSSNKNLEFYTTTGAGTSAERMRIDPNGNVGIGTSSPSAALHVVRSNSGGNVVTVQNTHASGYSSLDFYNHSGSLSGTFGFGNSSAASPFTGRTYFNSYGNDFLLANGSNTPLLVQGSTNNVGVNNTNPSEKLDVTGNIRFSGALMPNNTAGTAGYVLQSNGAGSSPTWVDPTTASSGWLLNGNNVPGIRNLGTTSNYDLPFITNNTEKMRISNTGNVGIGTSSFNGTYPERLLVDAGSTGNTNYQNVIVGKGNTNSYAQLNIQNSSNGTAASADVVATANNGNESTNFIDMGINGGSNSSTGVLGGANTAYLYSTGNDFSIGNASNNRHLNFFTTSSSTSTERMRITSAGDVGIGTSTPNYQLQLHKAAASSNWMQITNSSTGTGTYDGFFYGVTAAGQPQIWGEGDMAVITGSGTTNNQTLTLTEDGNVGINTSTFNGTYPEQLLVNAGSTGNTNYQNVIVGKGNTNSYAQLNIQNSSAGNAASADVVATANNGNETTNFIDMGINGGSNSSTGVLGGNNTAYLYATGNDFVIGNSTNSRDLIFYTTASSTSTERMRLTSAGHLVPGANNAYNLGSSSLRWATIYSQNLLNVSDARLKTNIRKLNYGLSTVMKMQPVKYNWKEGSDKEGIGFLAQDLRKIVPEAVAGDESKETLAVNYVELIPVLVNAIKEQQKQIDDLKKLVQVLAEKK